MKQKDFQAFKPYLLTANAVTLGEEKDNSSIVLSYAGLKPATSGADEQEKAEQFADEAYQLSIHLPELNGQNVTVDNGMTPKHD